MVLQLSLHSAPTERKRFDMQGYKHFAPPSERKGFTLRVSVRDSIIRHDRFLALNDGPANELIREGLLMSESDFQPGYSGDAGSRHLRRQPSASR